MRSLFVSAALSLTVAGSTAAAQTPNPESSAANPQATAPPRQAQNVTPTTIRATLPGPINATGTNAAYVSAEAIGRPAVYFGSDASPYGIVGTFSNDPLGFRTNNIGRMFIDLSGNVGIGTAAPGYRLDVSGDANITGTYRVNGVPISATSNWTQAGSDISYTGGNVGIGTPTPAHALQVGGTTLFGVPGGLYGFSVDSGPAGPYPMLGFNIFNNSGSYLSGAPGYSGLLQFQDANGSLIYYSTSASVAAGAPPVLKSRFWIDRDGHAAFGDYFPLPGAQLRVEATDYTGVYANAPSGIGVAGFSKYSEGVRGGSQFGFGVYGATDLGVGVRGSADSPAGYAGYFAGKVTVTGVLCASNVSCSSDARLKQDIEPLSYGLHELLQLRPVRWQWKDTTTTQLNLGLVAQDVEPVLPELILRNVDRHGSLGLNYFGLVPVLINAIQEQQDAIAALKAENTSQDVRIRALEQALQRLQEPR